MLFPKELIERLERSGVVAGFAVEKAEHAVPIAKVLLAGGIDSIELTLRPISKPPSSWAAVLSNFSRRRPAGV